MLSRFAKNYLMPLLRRPSRFQVAAICYRAGTDGPEVLLITSLTTKRWIVPKGWPKAGLSAAGSALDEAWEEAGVQPTARAPFEMGQFTYIKKMRGGVPARTNVTVFGIEVASLAEDYPEAGMRDRRWLPVQDAARIVSDTELTDILKTFRPPVQNPVHTPARAQTEDIT
ncbi:NUDIX hydrolase [Tropicibacter naphthalenivorans]|uniref:NUDIX domain protein n=1 Tax=Tropicibacter naphthalenivorans TaxID=441103 RepID=A0A0P1H328_9RHOB|nr:NUDIX hydrolase [Tropicibacter naphthalenivorans]CUH82053.1 NUDIX domain protein [Tropicibacter naphthalenivorans]SMD08341.1 8-oxo-dGTP pyrophosphatase MutT, NUDIX family [Tropicibacter naphthalenivorans]